MSDHDDKIRANRGRKYSGTIPLHEAADQPSVLRGEGSHQPADEAMPVSESDMVILGQVTGAEAFISTDKTAVYSAFQVTVEEIYKNCYPLGINPGVRNN